MVKENAVLERGKRLRALREQTGLSRIAFAKQLGISEHTLKAFENGSRELSPQGAREYSRIFLLVGMDVSFELLYYGREADFSEQKEAAISEEQNIDDEVMYFKKRNSSSIILKVQDSLMSPFYNKGDIVGGQKILNADQFSLTHGHACIIELTNGSQCLRRVLKSDGRKVMCCSLSTDSSTNLPIVEEIEAFSIAQVTRHWHLATFVRSSQAS
jgi:transcriptional regulator with XRE-family HTH domain